MRDLLRDPVEGISRSSRPGSACCRCCRPRKPWRCCAIARCSSPARSRRWRRNSPSSREQDFAAARRRGAVRRALAGQKFPPLFVVESEFRLALVKAELAFVNELVRRIVEEGWGPVDMWRERAGRGRQATRGPTGGRRPDQSKRGSPDDAGTSPGPRTQDRTRGARRPSGPHAQATSQGSAATADRAQALRRRMRACCPTGADSDDAIASDIDAPARRSRPHHRRRHRRPHAGARPEASRHQRRRLRARPHAYRAGCRAIACTSIRPAAARCTPACRRICSRHSTAPAASRAAAFHFLTEQMETLLAARRGAWCRTATTRDRHGIARSAASRCGRCCCPGSMASCTSARPSRATRSRGGRVVAHFEDGTTAPKATC